MGVTRAKYMGISVSDVERSLVFYRVVLGLDPVMDMDVERHAGLDAVVAMTDTVGRVVMLAAWDSLVEMWCHENPVGRPLPNDYQAADRGVTHVALQVEVVDATYRRVDAGFRAKSNPVYLGIHETCCVHGPDDEIIELFEDRSDREMMARVTRCTIERRLALRSSS
ncbi:MAG: hypothetical protein RIQ64_660 [Actinomycetota bacterium]